MKTYYQQLLTMAIRTIILFSAYLIFSISLSAQERDMQLRLSPSLTYKFSKKWRLYFDYRISFKDDISSFNSSNFQLFSSYKFFKKLSLGAGYRFTTSYPHDAHRFFVELQYDQKINDFELSSSTRYQFTLRRFDSDFLAEYKSPTQYIREKITLNYKIPKSKISVNLAPEFFVKLDNSPIRLQRMRYHLGAEYKFKYGNNVGFDIFYEDEIRANKDDRIVFNLKYNLDINDLIKKVKKDRNKRLKKRL